MLRPVPLLTVLLLATTSAHAAPAALPAGLEQDVETYLGRPALSGGCRLSSEMIRSFAIEAEIQCGEDEGRVQLWPLDASGEGEEISRTPSFSIRLVEGTSPALHAAARELAARVKAHDDGTFFAKADRLRSRISAAEGQEHHPDGAGVGAPGSTEASAQEHGRWDSLRRLLVWLALLGLLTPLAVAALRQWWGVPEDRRWFLVLTLLLVLAVVIRVVLPPWAPLHANAHGVAELRGLASAPSSWMGPVESDRYGAEWRQLVRAVIQLWKGGATSALAFSALLSSLAVLLLGVFTRQVTKSWFAGILGAVGLALNPIHVAMSPSESPMGFAGTLLLLALTAGCAAPALVRWQRIAAWWVCGLALAAACELSVVTLLFPVAAVIVLLGIHGRNLWKDRTAWILPALLVAATMGLHFVALRPIFEEAGVRRAGHLVEALLSEWKGHRNALLDPTLTSPLLLPLALLGSVALATRIRPGRTVGLLMASLLLFGGCSVIAVCRTDVIRYQPNSELLLFVLAGASVLLVPARRAGLAVIALVILLALTSQRGLTAIRAPLLDAGAWKIVQAAEPRLPPVVTIHIAPRRMAGSLVLNDFPEFLLQSHGHHVRMIEERAGAENGEGCAVWLGPPCYSFTIEELARGEMAHAIRLGDAALRPECRELVQRIDSARAPIQADTLMSPFPEDEFFEASGHPLVGLFPCSAAKER